MSKKSETTALSIPTIQSVQPKPTKTEIVEAMVSRAKVKHDAENDRRKAERIKLMAKIEDLGIKAAKGGKSRKPDVYTNSDKSVTVTFRYVKTPEIAALVEQYKQLSTILWEEKEVRKAIREELSGTGRVSPTRLLDNPDAVKAIDAMLTQWGM